MGRDDLVTLASLTFQLISWSTPASQPSLPPIKPSTEPPGIHKCDKEKTRMSHLLPGNEPLSFIMVLVWWSVSIDVMTYG